MKNTKNIDQWCEEHKKRFEEQPRSQIQDELPDYTNRFSSFQSDDKTHQNNQ